MSACTGALGAAIDAAIESTPALATTAGVARRELRETIAAALQREAGEVRRCHWSTPGLLASVIALYAAGGPPVAAATPAPVWRGEEPRRGGGLVTTTLDADLETVRDLAPDAVRRFEQARDLAAWSADDPNLPPAARDRLQRKVTAARESIQELAAAVRAQEAV